MKIQLNSSYVNVYFKKKTNKLDFHEIFHFFISFILTYYFNDIIIFIKKK